MKRKSIIIWAILSFSVILGLSFLVYSQNNTVTVSGVVSDSNTGDPLVQASVVLEGTSIGTSTGLSGEYTLPNVPKNGVLTASYIGYESKSLGVNSRATIHFALEPSWTNMDGVPAVGQ